MGWARIWGALVSSAFAVAACTSISGLSGAEDPLPEAGTPEDGGSESEPACSADTKNDPNNCGACGKKCATGPFVDRASCSNGVCGITCVADHADCDGDPSNGCEAVLATDPKACGRCKHDCLGGACAAGKCQPVTIWEAPMNDEAGPLAVDETDIYFTTFGSSRVIRCAKSGPCGAGQDVVSTKTPSPRFVAVSPTQVYWTNQSTDRVLRCPKGTQCISGIDVMQNVKTAFGIAIDAVNVYATANVSSNMGAIYMCPLTGCPNGVGSPNIVAQNQDGPSGIATDGATLAWALAGNGNAAIWRASTTAPANPSPLAGGQLQPYKVAVKDGFVYWSNWNGSGAQGSINRCPTTGCGTGPEKLAGPHKGGPDVAVDATDVYYVTGDGILRRVAKTGGAATDLATGLGFAWLVLDDTTIYVSAPNTKPSRLIKLAK